MLGFSCSICAPNSNISQHESYSPLAISFSHRAKVTWLTTVSHLTMQKDYHFFGLLSIGEASSLLLFFNSPSNIKCCRLRACAALCHSVCVKCCLYSRSFPGAHLITPVEKNEPEPFLAYFQGQVFHLLPLISLLLHPE